jgi:hypothetical protein
MTTGRIATRAPRKGPAERAPLSSRSKIGGSVSGRPTRYATCFGDREGLSATTIRAYSMTTAASAPPRDGPPLPVLATNPITPENVAGHRGAGAHQAARR